MKSKATCMSAILILIFSFGGTALAVKKLVIPNDDVKVFAGPSVTSPVLTILKKGKTVTAGVNPGGGFKKVLIIDARGKKVIGYVSLIDLKPPIFAVAPKSNDKDKKKAAKAKGKHNTALSLRGHYSMGFEIGIDYQNQGARTVNDSNLDSASASGLSGTGLLIGVTFNIPVKKSTLFETDLIYKPTTVTGNGPETTLAGAQTGNSTPVNISLKIPYLVVSETAKFYSESSEWWYGPGVEFDHALSGTVLLGGAQNQASYNSTDFKDLFMVFVATGYDFMSSKTFYITPLLRFGALFGSPTIIEADILISGTYRF